MSLKDRIRKLFSRNKTQQKIIIFNDNYKLETELQAVSRDLLGKYKARGVEVLPLVNGVLCKVPADKVNELAQEKSVHIMEDNVEVKIPKLYNKGLYNSHQFFYEEIIPWGTARIGADKCWEVTRGKAVKLAVMDSGINTAHQDLKNNVKGGINLGGKGGSYEDDNGHGTHIAGTVAALENGMGIIGVAPETELYAVKVLDYRGKGTVSGLIKGLAWCVENKMNIVNMSLGTDTQSKALHIAVREAYRAGVLMVAAAGNDGADNAVDYPAAYPEVLAVGAVDHNDELASFNSNGPEVKLLAPGTAIASAGLGGVYQRMSGTSMAAAHVSGVAALVMQRKKIAAHILARHLVATSERLTGVEGAGLVRADRAVQVRVEGND